MTEAMIQDIERRGVLEVGYARAPPVGETMAKPRLDEVLVFHDFFVAGLRFPLNLVVMEIFKLFKVFLHQMTPTSFLRLNLYLWMAKTCLGTQCRRVHTRLQVPLPAEDRYRARQRRQGLGG